jgi:hypothetical protein
VSRSQESYGPSITLIIGRLSPTVSPANPKKIGLSSCSILTCPRSFKRRILLMKPSERLSRPCPPDGKGLKQNPAGPEPGREPARQPEKHSYFFYFLPHSSSQKGKSVRVGVGPRAYPCRGDPVWSPSISSLSLAPPIAALHYFLIFQKPSYMI